jgi:hypothetical protein
MAYTAPDISQLSAYDLNKIQQSLNKYTATQGSYKDAPGWDPSQRGFRSQFEIAKEKAAAPRRQFQRGSGYGIEDEYRYMVSQGFEPSASQPVAPTPTAPEPEPSGPEPYTPQDIEGLVNSAINAAMPPPQPLPTPTFVNQAPSLVPTKPLSIQANTPSVQRRGNFQRRGANQLKINQTLNV